jgi:hypothetical protein
MKLKKAHSAARDLYESLRTGYLCGKSDHDGPVQDTNPHGGILTDSSVDLTVRSVVATIRVTENHASRVYRLRLHDVEALRVDRPDVGWD